MLRLAPLALLLASLAARAGPLPGEILQQTLPPGYRLDYQLQQDQLQMSSMVPDGQSARHWDEMITTQIFRGLKVTTPQAFRDVVVRQWRFSCPGSDYDVVADGKENGYPYALWYLACPSNPATGRPEHTWFKSIQGHDSFYVIQKAFKFAPGKAQLLPWLQYLRSVQLCDSRLPASRCPPDPH
ncbi:hypothetical protein [Vogesella oryzae]|uniref:hypothetical protein n=1 Tax=Vogesella oryzae TaxID=1735285 RepID=UPI0015828D22|nr:hypothetical protein [Vogesella oryzae]